MTNKDEIDILKAKIKELDQEQNYENYTEVINQLLNCEWWIPCTSDFEVEGREELTDEEKYELGAIKTSQGLGVMPIFVDAFVEEESKEGDRLLPLFSSKDFTQDEQFFSPEIISLGFVDAMQIVMEFEDVEGIIIDPPEIIFNLPREAIEEILAALTEGSTLQIEMGDITQSDAECIVNAANNTLLGGGGVDGAIHRAAGPKLLEECRTLNGCATGQAKITKGYNLKADYVIHTVGPIYSGKPQDADLLAKSYRNSLDLALEHDIKSIAFPVISTGAYGYPLEEAVPVIVEAIASWQNANPEYGINISIVCFDKKTQDAFTKHLNELMEENMD